MPSLFTELHTFGFHPIATFLFLPVLSEDLSLFVTKSIKLNIIHIITPNEKKQTTETRQERVEKQSETRQCHIGQDSQIQDTEVEKEAENEIDTTATTETTEETETEHHTNHHVSTIDIATNETEEAMIEKGIEEDRTDMNEKEDPNLHIAKNITEKDEGSTKIEKTDLIGQLHPELTHPDANEDHHTKIKLVIDQGRDHCKNHHSQVKGTSDTRDTIEQTKHQTELN